MNKFIINPKLNKIRLEFLPCFGEMEEVVDVERVVAVVLGDRTGGWCLPRWRQKVAGQNSGGSHRVGGKKKKKKALWIFLFFYFFGVLESCLFTWMTTHKEYLAEIICWKRSLSQWKFNTHNIT